ncbi:hypothetical protein CWI36_2254p0010 [Hamiltosporidium magnivora]|uniref:Uncharacterized protein n=1 Tax=Hamiltosporidium magnivora TaxID=148818 RepID=A0A4Q9KV31_9MICR|nr:hypothetical protein CWI36_2254p0010 [Hamiltosporidium magnivora]
MVNASRYLASTSRITASNIDKNIETDTEVCRHFEEYKKRIIECKDSNKIKRNLLTGDRVLI